MARPDPKEAERKVLVTCFAGMLGRDLLRELATDYALCGIDVVGRRSSPAGRLRFAPHSVVGRACVIDCDITDARRVREVIRAERPRVVIHAAAWTDVDGCEGDERRAYRVNAAGTMNVARACKAAGAALVYISTDFVFDGKKRKAYVETDRPRPLSVYGDSKLKGEEAVRKTLKAHYIIRTGWLYGAAGKNFADTIAAKAKDGGVLRVVSDQVGSPTFTKDLAAAIHALLGRVTTPRGRRAVPYGIYHVSNAGRVSWYGYAGEIVRLVGSGAEVLPISSAELGRPAKRPAMSVLDNGKFTRSTGFRMRHWREALVDYLRQRERGKGRTC